MSSATAAWAPPLRFDDFVIVRALGRGGMGHVYLGREELLDRSVALKFIASTDPTEAARARFITEARAIARLGHANVVGVYRIGEVDGRPYIAYEFVPGQSLDRIPRPLRWTAALRIGSMMAKGLEACHRAGILHRDIKPANVMLSDRGQIKLLDFGLAKVDGGGDSALIDPSLAETRDGTDTGTRPMRTHGLTRPGTLIGTPAYLAPEQWSGEPASPRSDVFSFGVVMHELMTGMLPHGGRDTQELASNVMLADIPPVRSRAPDVPESVAQVIDRCLKRNPLERYRNAHDLRVALEEIESVFLPATAAIDTVALQNETLSAAASLARVSARMNELTTRIYDEMFRLAPHMRSLFPEDLRRQREKLWHALKLAVEGLREPEKLAPVLRDLGRRHADFGVAAGDYDLLGEILLDTMRMFDAPDWNEDLSRSWKRAYAFIADAMRKGGADANETKVSMGFASTPSPEPPEPRSKPTMPVPKTRYARAGKTSLAYQVFGEGPVDVVVLLGWLTHVEMAHKHVTLATFLASLAEKSRVILFDKRGSGLSDRANDAVGPETRVADLAAVMDAAESPRAVIFGVSEGASIGALFAAHHPDRVRGLVAYGGSAKRLRSDDYPHGQSPEHIDRLSREIEEKWGDPVFVELEAPSMAGDEAFAEWLGSYMRTAASPTAANEMFLTNAALDVRSVLPKLSCPTLVLHREGDRVVPVDDGRYFAAQVPGARFVPLVGADHLPFVGDSERVLAEIEAFLATVR